MEEEEKEEEKKNLKVVDLGIEAIVAEVMREGHGRNMGSVV